MSHVYLRPCDAVTDNDRLLVSRTAAEMSVLVKDMLADDDEETPEIPLLNVTRPTLIKVMEFCEKHASDPMVQISKPIKSTDMRQIVGEWDATYIDLEHKVLFDVILAANFMDIPSLLDLGCAKVASMIKSKTPEEIKEMFNIDKNSTPEEDEQVRRDNPWIFEV